MFLFVFCFVLFCFRFLFFCFCLFVCLFFPVLFVFVFSFAFFNSCEYSPVIHGKHDYYFPINKLRLHNTPNASHSMLTSGCPSDFHHPTYRPLHAHIQWSTACTHLVVHQMRHIQWSTGCGTFGGPPRAHFPMHEDVTSGGPLVGN